MKNFDEVEIEIWPTFEDFWEAYDKKVGKKIKIKAKFDRLPHETKNAIMAYIPDYKLSQPDKQFRKNPETFLNNESKFPRILKFSANRSVR